jgi:hypothetical protein
MMKVFALFCILALAASVPISQNPEKTEEVATTEAAPVTATETPVEEKTETKTEEPAAKTEEPAAKTEDPAAKTEEPAAKTEEPAAKTEEAAPATEEPATKTEEPATEEKTETLKQVVNLMETLTGGLNEKDGKSLKEFMDMGANIMAEAEEKAKDIQGKLDATNLLQGDAILGVKDDGTIDPAAAADQITTLINVFAGPNTVTPQDKDMMKQVITSVSGLMAPMLNQLNNPNEPAAFPPVDLKQLEPLLKLLMPPMDGQKDSLLQPENLIKMFSAVTGAGDAKADEKTIGDLTNKFLELMEGEESEN